jgi:hypothetical protein
VTLRGVLPLCGPGSRLLAARAGRSALHYLRRGGWVCIDSRDCVGDELFCNAAHGRCEQLRALGEACVYQLSCNVGSDLRQRLLRAAARLCKPTAAAGGACSSGRSNQCPDGQYCQNQLCTPTVALNSDCSGRSADACGPSAFCRDAHTCTSTPAEGDACDVSTGLVCPSTGDLQCIDPRCLPAHARPHGASCAEDGDCVSKFCHVATAQFGRGWSRKLERRVDQVSSTFPPYFLNTSS